MNQGFETPTVFFRIEKVSMFIKKFQKKQALWRRFLFALIIISLACFGQACELSRFTGGVPRRPQNSERQLFSGVRYYVEVIDTPRMMVAHIVTVDLNEPGVRVLVTPPENADAKEPLASRTTSEFLQGFEVQLAINGSGFKPWYVIGPLYYPHSGDLVHPLGHAVSRGTVYSQDTGEQPVIYFSPNNKASILIPPNNTYNAIAGLDWILQNGQSLEQLGKSVHPRTSVGINRAGSKLVIMVIDGRQPGYSEGATLNDVVRLMLRYGAWDAINLDGGGSSTLVMADENGEPVVLNSPIHLGIPGNERPVGNHLGIYAKP